MWIKPSDKIKKIVFKTDTKIYLLTLAYENALMVEGVTVGTKSI